VVRRASRGDMVYRPRSATRPRRGRTRPSVGQIGVSGALRLLPDTPNRAASRACPRRRFAPSNDSIWVEMALASYIIATGRAVSSAGRAPALHAGCRRFEPVTAHHPSPRGLRVAGHPKSRLGRRSVSRSFGVGRLVSDISRPLYETGGLRVAGERHERCSGSLPCHTRVTVGSSQCEEADFAVKREP
jgi:hypothetical protein